MSPPGLPFDRIEVTTPAPMREKLQELGMLAPGADGLTYWNAKAAYVLDTPAAARLLRAAEELQALCREAIGAVVEAGDYAPFGVTSPAMAQAIETSWRAGEPGFHGRMDFTFARDGSPRLLDYEGDGPVGLPEASWLQWEWQQAWSAGRAGESQENMLYEHLIEAWKDWRARFALPASFPIAMGGAVLASGMPDDTMERFTAEFLAETALEAGITLAPCGIGMIGWDTEALCFTGPQDEPLTTLAKLYPWAWMEQEPNIDCLPQSRTRILPAAWTRLLADKTLLALLWRRHRHHPLLLPAALDPAELDGPLVAKPVRGRDGGQVALPGEAPTPRPPGDDDDTGPLLYQQHCPLPVFGGVHAAASAWMVGDRASGLGFRESTLRVTGPSARFVPHLLRG